MIQYLIIIILIIGFIYLSNKDNFWNQLPVSNNKIINYGYITNNFNIKKISNKYKFFVFDPNKNINYIIDFINFNSNLLNNDNNNDIDIELFRYESINSLSFMNNYIILYLKKKIIGLIVNSPCQLYFYNSILSVNQITYLVVDNNFNYNSLFKILFSYNIQKNIYKNYKSFIFYKDKVKYPFNYLCKCRYYTKDLYNVQKNYQYGNISMYKNDNNIDRFFDFYNRKVKLYKIYRIFKRDDFHRYFDTILPIVYCFYEELGNEVISLCVIKRKKNIGYITFVLSDNIINFMENILYICKKLGLVTIKGLDMMNNIVFLEKLHFKKSYYRYYHMFNFHVNFNVSSSEFAYVV